VTASTLPALPRTAFTKDEALAHTARLNASIDETLDLIFEAWVGRIWEDLEDVADWASYVEVYAPRIKTLKLPVVDRRALAAKWAEAGAPTRDFARGVNVSNGTAAGDYAKVTDIEEARERKVISKNGSLRPQRVAKRATKAAPKVSKRDRAVQLISAAPDGLTALELAEATGWRGGQATGTTSDLKRQGRIRALPIFRDGYAVLVLTEAESAKAAS